MAGIRGSRAPFDYVTGTERNDRAEILSCLLYNAGQNTKHPLDERMERVNRIRAAILNGQYRVRSGDIAQSLLDTMRGGSGLRLREEVAHPTSLPAAFVWSTQGTTDATFRSQQASESAEEV